MNRVDVGGFELRVDVQGSGPHNFLCLHGLVDRLEIWDALAKPLSERGRMVRIDQRGHGESDAPEGPTPVKTWRMMRLVCSTRWRSTAPS